MQSFVHTCVLKGLIILKLIVIQLIEHSSEVDELRLFKIRPFYAVCVHAYVCASYHCTMPKWSMTGAETLSQHLTVSDTV